MVALERRQRVLRLGRADEADRAADDRRPGAARRRRASRAGGTARSVRCRSPPRPRRGAAPTARRRPPCASYPRPWRGPAPARRRRKQCTSLSAGSRPAVIPTATIRASQRIGAPAASAARALDTSRGWTTRSSTRSTWPLPWIIRTASCSASGGTAVEPGLAADRRERVDVDGGPVRDVVVVARRWLELGHRTAPLGTSRPRHGVTTTTSESAATRSARDRSTAPSGAA